MDLDRNVPQIEADTTQIRQMALNLIANGAEAIGEGSGTVRIRTGVEDVSAEQIEDDAPLFGPGLGLDSIDALELVVLLERDYGIVIKDMEEGRPAFQSVRTLAAFIEAKRSP